MGTIQLDDTSCLWFLAVKSQGHIATGTGEPQANAANNLKKTQRGALGLSTFPRPSLDKWGADYIELVAF
jgi:hypothetical protein